MKTFTLLTALALLVSTAFAQVNERTANDLNALKKSNAALKSRLNEQQIFFIWWIQ